MRRLIFVPLVAGALLGACASGQSGGPAGGTGRASRDVLAGEEIRAHPDISTALDAIRRLRPEFLRNRGMTSIRASVPEPIVVYVNGVNTGSIDILQQILATDVKEIRYINSRDATTRYGTGHVNGAIVVVTGN